MRTLRLASHGRPAAAAASAVVLLCALQFYRTANPWMTGDEPHYVIYAKSIGHGWGLDLQRAYAPEHRRRFFDGDIDPHAGFFAGPEGRFASWHGPVLPLVLAPLAVLDPPAEAYRWLMIGIAALLAYHLCRLTLAVTGAPAGWCALGVALVLVSPPAIYFSGQVYPELLAALLLVLALRSLVSARPPAMRLSTASLAISVLPWLNIRYVTITLAVGLLIVVIAVRDRSVRALLGAIAVSAASALGLMAFNLELYGHPVAKGDFSAAFDGDHLYLYGVGPIIGFPNGLLPLAPILIVALTAVPVAVRRLGAGPTVAGASIALAYIVFNAYFGSPGFSVPGRYQVSVVPLLAVPLVVVLAGGRLVTRCVVAAAFALTVVSITTSARRFPALYTSDRRHVQPLGATANWWPMMTPEVLPSGMSQTPLEITPGVGRLETLDGSPYLVAREGRDPEGVLAHLPVTRLQNGKYEVAVALYLEPAAAPGAVGIHVVDDESRVLASESVPFPATPRTAPEHVPFESTDAAPVGVIVTYPGGGVAGVGPLSVRQVQAFPPRRIADERWKSGAWLLALAGAGWVWRRSTKSLAAKSARV